MNAKEQADFLTAANQTFDRINAEYAERKRQGKMPLSRNELIKELKTNAELRAAVRDVLAEEVMP